MHQLWRKFHKQFHGNVNFFGGIDFYFKFIFREFQSSYEIKEVFEKINYYLLFKTFSMLFQIVGQQVTKLFQNAVQLKYFSAPRSDIARNLLWEVQLDFFEQNALNFKFFL